MNPRAITRAVLATALLAATCVGLGACGASGDATTEATSTRAAAQAAEVCPNVGSNAAALILDNRLGIGMAFRASQVRCAQWSERGNPTTYSDRSFGGWNKVVHWGLQPATGATPSFLATFVTSPEGTPVTSLQVRLGQEKQATGYTNWQPTWVETRSDDVWHRNGSYIVGTAAGKQVRVVTGVVNNPGDGSWDSPNGAGLAQRAWFIRLQYVK